MVCCGNLEVRALGHCYPPTIHCATTAPWCCAKSGTAKLPTFTTIPIHQLHLEKYDVYFTDEKVPCTGRCCCISVHNAPSYHPWASLGTLSSIHGSSMSSSAIPYASNSSDLTYECKWYSSKDLAWY